MISFAALVIQICGLVINVTFSIINMIYGWGVQPKSWMWILLITPVGQIIGILFLLLAERLRKEEERR